MGRPSFVGGGGENGLGPSMALALRADFVRPNRLSCRFVNSLRGSIRHGSINDKAAKKAALSMLVEVARIELASASPTLRDLHAYSVFNLAVGYPTGRENLQPVQ